MSDQVEVIPGGGSLDHAQVLDVRQSDGGRALLQVDSVIQGADNVRMQVRLVTPGFSIDLGGKELAKRLAVMIRDKLSANYAAGLDAQGSPLPALKQKTIQRRERRKRARIQQFIATAFDTNDASGERYWLRGKPSKFKPTNPTTPLNESGLFAAGVSVQFKGTVSGDPIFIIAFASGGKERGLTNDDGKGARLFAAEHYGFARLMDIPHELDGVIEQALDNHLAAVLEQTGSVFGLLAKMSDRIDRFVADASSGEGAEA